MINNKNYQKAKNIADKYNLYSYDQMAMSIKRDGINLERYINGEISYEEYNKTLTE